MSNKVHVSIFLGQGGWTTSAGFGHLSYLLGKLGVECDVYRYQDYQLADTKIKEKLKDGYKIAVLGFSLGNSAGTYLGTFDHIDLLICLFESSLAQNYKINHHNVVHSVLYHGQDFLSNAGWADGFDERINVEITPVTIPVLDHLLGQFDQSIINGITTRIYNLQGK